jgi:hypothetical protein
MTVKIKKGGYTCCDCGKRTVFSPSLTDRGMTVAEAQCIFVDAKAGRCVDCFIEYRKNR